MKGSIVMALGMISFLFLVIGDSFVIELISAMLLMGLFGYACARIPNNSQNRKEK